MVMVNYLPELPSYAMNLHCGKQLPAPVEWTYGIFANRTSTERMSPSSRATRAPVALYRAVGPAGKAGSKLRRASEISLTTPSLDLATRLRVFQRALRSRVERRDALLDIVRAVNTTLEPPKVAETLVERAVTWVPAPCWAVVSSDLSGQLSVLADRGLAPDMGPAVYAIAEWVMHKGQEFVSADLRRDVRLSNEVVGTVT